MLLIWLSCAFVAGILLGHYWEPPWAYSLIGVAVLLSLFFVRRHRRRLLTAGLGLFAFFIAAAGAYPVLYAVDVEDVHFYNGRGLLDVEGTVAAAPDVRDGSTRITIKAEAVTLDGQRHEVDGKVLVIAPRYPAHAYGDVLRLTGELATPPVLGDFDYRGYLAHRDIHATMYYPGITTLETGRGFKPLGWIYGLREKLAANLARVLPEPQAGLAQGIVLGIRGNISPELRESFARSGTAHLLAISGLHLGIMAGVMLAIGLWLFGRRHYLYVWLALATVWLYVFITGMHLPVLRGAIMASLFLLAELLGRQRSGIVALTLAAALMTGFSPWILGDASFQLSFLAMAGLVFLFPAFRNWGRRAVEATLGETGAAASFACLVVDALSATLAAIIAVWPVVAYYFGIVSLVGPLATLLALPALPGAIILSTLAAFAGLVLLPAAQAIGWLAWLFLSYIIAVINGLAVAPVAPVSLHPAFVWGYYIVLAAVIWLYANRRRWLAAPPEAAGAVAGRSLPAGYSPLLKWLVVPLLAAAVLVVFTAATLPDDRLRVAFLDVGQGDAILIQKGNTQVLVDGGPSPQALHAALGRQMPFWDREIEMAVLTQPHNDHLAGLVDAVGRYNVAQVIYPAVEYDSSVYQAWCDLLDAGVFAIPAEAGQVIDMGGGAVIRVLNPLPEPLIGTQSDVDNNGVVLYLHQGDVGFLLTADIMAEAELEMVTGRVVPACTVLKVGHHGSATSTGPAFLAAASPQAAVISVGADNRYGHPDEDVLARLQDAVGLERVYRTDERGTVVFTTDGQSLRVETVR